MAALLAHGYSVVQGYVMGDNQIVLDSIGPSGRVKQSLSLRSKE
jgi:hypothetical protein